MVALGGRIIKDPHWNCGLFIFCKLWGSCADSDAPTQTQTAAVLKAAPSAGGEKTACDINKTRSSHGFL